MCMRIPINPRIVIELLSMIQSPIAGLFIKFIIINKSEFLLLLEAKLPSGFSQEIKNG